MNLESLYDARQAAAYLGISVSALHRLCARGRVASLRIGMSRLFRKELIHALAIDDEYLKRTRRRRQESLNGQREIDFEAS